MATEVNIYDDDDENNNNRYISQGFIVAVDDERTSHEKFLDAAARLRRRVNLFTLADRPSRRLVGEGGE